MAKLHEMFQSAKDIMNWLGSCAKAVAAKGHSVEWVTPLGLPVRMTVPRSIHPGSVPTLCHPSMQSVPPGREKKPPVGQPHFALTRFRRSPCFLLGSPVSRRPRHCPKPAASALPFMQRPPPPPPPALSSLALPLLIPTGLFR